MKKLTFQRQVVLGIVILGIAHFLWNLTGNGYFVNGAWLFYGFLFVLHPVLPANAEDNSRNRKLVQLSGVIVILIGCMLRSGSADDFLQNRISEHLGVDVGNGAVRASMDDHSGFHGDGTMYVELSFADDGLEQVIEKAEHWHRLPLTDTLQTLIHGTRTDTATVDPYLDVSMPEPERGYWYFYDRQGETAQDDGVLHRGSYNYTIGIYDADADILYYCEYDT